MINSMFGWCFRILDQSWEIKIILINNVKQWTSSLTHSISGLTFRFILWHAYLLAKHWCQYSSIHAKRCKSKVDLIGSEANKQTYT
jgi:hypothetical protein